MIGIPHSPCSPIHQFRQISGNPARRLYSVYRYTSEMNILFARPNYPHRHFCPASSFSYFVCGNSVSYICHQNCQRVRSHSTWSILQWMREGMTGKDDGKGRERYLGKVHGRTCRNEITSLRWLSSVLELGEGALVSICARWSLQWHVSDALHLRLGFRITNCYILCNQFTFGQQYVTTNAIRNRQSNSINTFFSSLFFAAIYRRNIQSSARWTISEIFRKVSDRFYFWLQSK